MTLSTLGKAGLASLAALSSFAVIPSAQAAITFDFTGPFGTPTLEATSGGFKMVLSNYNSPTGNFLGNSTGIFLVDPTQTVTLGAGSQFTIQVVEDTVAMDPVDFVAITGYMVGEANEFGLVPEDPNDPNSPLVPVATLDLSGGSPVSEENPFNAAETFAFNSAPIALAAGQQAVLSASYRDFKAANTVKSLIIEVPEPLTMMGASAAIAFGAAFKKRRAAQK